MAKEATITVRVPVYLKRRLQLRARRQRRSLSAQVVSELETATAGESEPGPRGKLLDRYPGGSLPTDEDFREVRALLWGRLGRRRG